MAKTFTINNPKLIPGQYFKVWYRAYGASVWIPISNQTNAPFSIPGITPGDYELMAMMAYGSPEVECEPMIITFSIPDDDDPPVYCECVTVTDVEVFSLEGFAKKIVIKYEFSVETQPDCGWIIYLTPSVGNQPKQRYDYPSLPLNGVLELFYPSNIDSDCFLVEVVKNCCGEQVSTCHSENACVPYVPPPVNPPDPPIRPIPPTEGTPIPIYPPDPTPSNPECPTFEWRAAMIERAIWDAILLPNVFFYVDVNLSNAPTGVDLLFTYQQINTVLSGVNDSGSFLITWPWNVSSGNWIRIRLYPNMDVSDVWGHLGHHIAMSINYRFTLNRDGCSGNVAPTGIHYTVVEYTHLPYDPFANWPNGITPPGL